MHSFHSTAVGALAYGLPLAFGATLGTAIRADAWEFDKLYTLKTTPLLGAAADSANPVDTGYFFSRDSLSDGSYPRTSIPMREGGWSDLAVDPTDATGSTFFTVNDRGLNVAHASGGKDFKVFAYPNYHHKLVRFKIAGDSLEILALDSIKTLGGGGYTLGLPSTKAPTGEIALRMNRDTSLVDTADRIAPTPDGYDFEGIVLDGDSLFYLCDEYGPFIAKVNRAQMQLTKEWYPGHGLPGVLARRRANRGMEGMAITPSGKLLGLMQSPLNNTVGGVSRTDPQNKSRVHRLVWLDPKTDEVREFVYLNDIKEGKRQVNQVKIGGMTAIDENRFLVMEHGVDVAGKYWIDIYRIDLRGATNVTRASDPDSVGTLYKNNTVTLEQLGYKVRDLVEAGVTPVRKTLVAGDLTTVKSYPHQKPEGLVLLNDSTVAINNDNDYGMVDFGGDGIPHILPDNERVAQLMYVKIPNQRHDAHFKLTLLHNNDAESQIINAGPGLESFGGAARFKTLVDSLKSRANATVTGGGTGAGSGAQGGPLLISSGDNFLAGPEFSVSLARDSGEALYDGLAMDKMGYDAVVLGNHDFDFGPDVLTRFIKSFPASKPPFLSANLGFAGEPGLKVLADSGRIKKSHVIEIKGRKVGIVGATTPELRFISSPRKVTVDDSVRQTVQAEIDALKAQGVGIIVVASHLQSIKHDSALARQLKDADILIAGGGGELLANEADLLLPVDTAKRAYPLWVSDANNKRVPIVTTTSDYRYVGRLIAEFNASGHLVLVDGASGLVRVAGGSLPDSVDQNAVVKAEVVEPVKAGLAAFGTEVVGASEIALDGRRAKVRTQETNLGNLLTDALLSQGKKLAATFGVTAPQVALQNGGGIRNDAEIAAGNVTVLNTYDVAPFPNFLAVVPEISAAQFKEILENGVSQVASSGGRFAQIAGFKFIYNPNGTAQVLNNDGAVTTAGTRIWRVTLDDGTLLVDNGAVVSGAPKVSVATIDFLARGGDQYPFRGAAFTTLGISYQAALEQFIKTDLDGEVTAEDYPVAGEGRIVADSSPTSVLPTDNGVTAGLRQAHLNATGLHLAFGLRSKATVQVRLTDFNGRPVAEHELGSFASGSHVRRVNLGRMPQGIYLLEIRAGEMRWRKALPSMQ
jgi:2',3'-cyclic-nucleotide 2'-phosphodiesterase (5'-nucleotidase family)